MEFPNAATIQTKLYPNAPIASDAQPQEVGSALPRVNFVMEQQSNVMMVQMNLLKLVSTGFIVRHKVVARYITV